MTTSSSASSIKEPLSGQDFPRTTVSEEGPGKILDCIGVGCRHKKIGFIELKIYAFACYMERESLKKMLSSSSSSSSSSTSTGAPNGASSAVEEAERCYTEVVRGAAGIRCELSFMKPIPAKMMGSSLREDLGPFVNDEEEIQKAEALAPPDGIANGTRLVLWISGGEKVDPQKDGKALPSICSKPIVAALAQLYFRQKDFVRGFPASVGKEMKFLQLQFGAGGGSASSSALKPPGPAAGNGIGAARGLNQKGNGATFSASTSSAAEDAGDASRGADHKDKDVQKRKSTCSSSSASTSTSSSSEQGASPVAVGAAVIPWIQPAQIMAAITDELKLIPKQDPQTAASSSTTAEHQLSRIKLSGELLKFHLDGGVLRRSQIFRAWSPRQFSLENGKLSYKKTLGKPTTPFLLNRVSVVIVPSEKDQVLEQAGNGRGQGGSTSSGSPATASTTSSNADLFIFQIVDLETKEPLFRLAAKEFKTAKRWVTHIVASAFLLRKEAEKSRKSLQINRGSSIKTGAGGVDVVTATAEAGFQGSRYPGQDADDLVKTDSLSLLDGRESGRATEKNRPGISTTGTGTNRAATSSSAGLFLQKKVNWFAVSVCLLAVVLLQSFGAFRIFGWAP